MVVTKSTVKEPSLEPDSAFYEIMINGVQCQMNEMFTLFPKQLSFLGGPTFICVDPKIL